MCIIIIIIIIILIITWTDGYTSMEQTLPVCVMSHAYRNNALV
jgi:hypothetical protein